MEKVRCFGKMVHITQDSGNIVMPLAMANSASTTERYTKVNGKMVGPMVKAPTKTKKMLFSKDCIKTTCSQDLELKHGLMAPNTKEIMKMARSMAMVFTHGMTARILKEIGPMAP